MKVQRGHLYVADLNPRFGSEPGKLRPVLVIQNDLLNSVHPSTWIIPCTTRLTPANILRVRLPKNSAGNTQECDVMIDQSRTIDNVRFKKHLGRVPPLLLGEVIEKLRLAADI